MDAQKIYDLLRGGGLSRAGALGVMGNLQAESGLNENIVQRGMTKLSDEQYTVAVDNGLLNFVDSIGYGLAQWTFSKRKENLLNFAKKKGTSVGDGWMQIEFLLQELTNDYPALYATLCTSTNIDQCADLVCVQFERPAVNNLSARRAFAHEFDAQVTDGMYTEDDAVKATFPPDPTVLAFQLWMNYNGYACKTDGYKSAEFFAVLDQFVEDMKSC